MTERQIRVVAPDMGHVTWQVEHTDQEPWQLELLTDTGATFGATGVDLFDCLKKIRIETDLLGVRLCCNGARRNARPSGYSSSLGAFAVYKLHRWRSALPGDLVDVFEYAPPRKIATVSEQEKYWDKIDAYRRSAIALLNPVFWITYCGNIIVRALHDSAVQRRIRKTAR